MLVGRAELSESIVQICEQASERMGRPITSAAVSRLKRPTGEFSRELIFDVDEHMLRETILGVLRIAAEKGDGLIDAVRIEAALASYKCHYLWFC